MQKKNSTEEKKKQIRHFQMRKIAFLELSFFDFNFNRLLLLLECVGENVRT